MTKVSPTSSVAKTGGLSLELMVVTAVVSLLVFSVLASGRWLQHVLGDIGLNITQRVMGLFVAAMGMQFILTGVVGVFTSQIAPHLSALSSRGEGRRAGGLPRSPRAKESRGCRIRHHQGVIW